MHKCKLQNEDAFCGGEKKKGAVKQKTEDKVLRLFMSLN